MDIPVGAVAGAGHDINSFEQRFFFFAVKQSSTLQVMTWDVALYTPNTQPPGALFALFCANKQERDYLS